MLSQTPFSFVANCKNLDATIKKVASVLATTVGGNFYIATENKRVYVVGLSGDTFVRIALHEVKADADGAFLFKYEDMVGLIKNRNEMSFTFSGATCDFKQVKGAYKGSLTLAPITTDQQTSCENFLKEKSKGDIVLPSELLSLIKEGLRATNIKDVYQNATLMSYITLTEDGKLAISSFDSQHFGQFIADSGHKKIAFQAALPASHFAMIDQIAAGADSKFAFAGGSLRVSGKGFTIVLPATQAEETSYNLVDQFVQNLEKPVFKCIVNLDTLNTITDNLFTLYNANTSFTLSYKEGAPKLGISFTTPSGTASDSMTVKTGKVASTVKAGVDPRLLKDVSFLAKNIKVPNLSINNKVIIFSGATNDGDSLFLACARAE